MIPLSVILSIISTALLVGLFVEMNILISNLSIIIDESRDASKLNNQILTNRTATINEILELSKDNNRILTNSSS